jgi:hypothetical protein
VAGNSHIAVTCQLRSVTVRAVLLSAVTFTLLTIWTSNVLGARAPTPAEAHAIARNFGTVPARCLTIRVSTVNRRYALTYFSYPTPRSCVRYGFNGIALLERNGNSWKPIFEGSSYKCSEIHVASAVKRDLKIPGCSQHRSKRH